MTLAEKALPGLRLDNSYRQLPDRFYAMVPPNRVRDPGLVKLNLPLAQELGLDVDRLDEDLAARIFTGDMALDETGLLSMAYSGHQFGHFNPHMGDGRAGLVTEVISRKGQRFDIQLKGSGRTPFSRNGDGKAALGPVMREYIVSEAMYALGIPTTRSLAIATTGEMVFREELLPGAVLTRVAASHLRIGTFQHFAARGDDEALKALTAYAVDRHYPELKKKANPPLALLETLIARQAGLVARWMSVGFIHGVMNTDNMAISGETIDYGPCAFMDHYEHNKVYSSIDQQGRYAFGAQPTIAQWNLARFAEALLPMIDTEQDKAVEMAKTAIETFPGHFMAAWSAAMGPKFGLSAELAANEKGRELMRRFLTLLHRHRTDFTNTFRLLITALETENGAGELLQAFKGDEEAEQWLAEWREAIGSGDELLSAAAEAMAAANPVYIPRNHLVAEAIAAAEQENDFGPMDALLERVSNPFEEADGAERYTWPPRPEEEVHQTFCGT